jgi:tetratricopeptide (TPR) repeat protein
MNLVGETYRSPMPWVDYAVEALQRSLHLVPDHPEALTLLGSLRHRFDYDWNAAVPCFRRAIDLAPNSAFAHTAFGFHLMLAGRLEEAESELKLARRLDPHYLGSRWHMVYLRIAQRRWADVESELAALMDLTPQDFRVLGMMATVKLYTGRAEAALAEFREVHAQAPHHSVGPLGLAQASFLLGDDAAGEASIAELKHRFANLYVSPYQLALVEMCRHKHDAAIQLLEEAAIFRDSNVIFAPSEPTFDPLHGDPRFDTLLARHRRAGM